MNFALIHYNLSYYLRKFRYIGLSLTFLVFLFVNYQSKPTDIWLNYYITAIAIFIFSNLISVSFINCEDETQQQITKMKIKNETVFYISKIMSILIFIIPFYIILIFYPIVFRFFIRELFVSEIIISLIIHFLFSLLGIAVGVFFDANITSNKNKSIPLQLLIILISVIPLTSVFPNNLFIMCITCLLPPVNFLVERFYALQSNIFSFDEGFIAFAVYSLFYSMTLITLYILLIRRKSKLLE